MSIATSPIVLRLGTRGSMLARMQSEMMADAIEKRHPHVKVELIICKTTGDTIQDKPLHEAGGKGLFTKELEEALLADAVDFAVHSYKDVPVTMPLVDQTDLVIAAVPAREDPRDVIASADGKAIHELPAGAKVGTGSMRRRCQILALRSDLQIEPIRGNIDTRLRKLADRQYDAIILALAGLKRSGMLDSTTMHLLPLEQMLPAAAQGALAIQCRRGDQRVLQLLAALDDHTTRQCVDLERNVVQRLNGDCHSPIAALATIASGRLQLRAAVGARGGELPVIRAHADADPAAASAALEKIIESLEKQGARELLGVQ